MGSLAMTTQTKSHQRVENAFSANRNVSILGKASAFITLKPLQHAGKKSDRPGQRMRFSAKVLPGHEERQRQHCAGYRQRENDVEIRGTHYGLRTTPVTRCTILPLSPRQTGLTWRTDHTSCQPFCAVFGPGITTFATGVSYETLAANRLGYIAAACHRRHARDTVEYSLADGQSPAPARMPGGTCAITR